LAGPVYRLLNRAGGVVHIRSFLNRCGRIEREKREAKRPVMERRVIREVGPDGTRDMPFLEAAPAGSTMCQANCASLPTGSSRAPGHLGCLRIGR